MQHKYSKKAEIILELMGQIIKEERNKLNKSQRLLADEYGVEKSLLNRIENSSNEAKIISIFTICEMLGIKPSSLIKRIEEKLPQGFSVLED